MIAFLCESPETWLAAGKAMRRMRRGADGPFRVMRGMLGGEEATAWRTEPSADEQYAAARMAVRRGATRLVHLGGADALEAFEPRRIVRAGRVVDCRGLADLQRIVPDLATELPTSWPDNLEAEEFAEPNDSDGFPGLATMAFPLTVPLLAHAIGERWGATLFDSSACGMCRAAREERVASVVWKMIDRELTHRSARRAGGAAVRMGAEGAWERFFAAVDADGREGSEGAA